LGVLLLDASLRIVGGHSYRKRSLGRVKTYPTCERSARGYGSDGTFTRKVEEF
jgi:hypothetical protein